MQIGKFKRSRLKKKKKELQISWRMTTDPMSGLQGGASSPDNFLFLFLSLPSSLLCSAEGKLQRVVGTVRWRLLAPCSIYCLSSTLFGSSDITCLSVARTDDWQLRSLGGPSEEKTYSYSWTLVYVPIQQPVCVYRRKTLKYKTTTLSYASCLWTVSNHSQRYWGILQY